ncbi:MAG: hypothetical protein ACLFM0_02580 [Spirochaetales bacterium]
MSVCGNLGADNRDGAEASVPAADGSASPLRIDYEPAEGIPRVFTTAGDNPLWSPDEQETSALFARIDNRVTRLSDERPDSITNADGALETVWREGGITVSLRTEILDIENATSTVRLRLSLSNEGRMSRDVGVRYLFDTWFGEASDAHFRLRTSADTDADQIEVERELTSDASVIESTGDEGSLRLLIDRGTTPEQVVAANRDRLSNAAWSYNSSRGRGFDLPPYSRNDSALHVTFASQELEAGDERRIELYFEVAGGERESSTAEESDRNREAADPPATPDDERDERSEPPSDAGETAEQPNEQTELPQTREEARTELRRELERLREISEGERQPEDGELEEIRNTIERLRRLRDNL